MQDRDSGEASRVDHETRVAMVDQETRGAMEIQETWGAMADQETQAAMVDQETQAVMADQDHMPPQNFPGGKYEVWRALWRSVHLRACARSGHLRALARSGAGQLGKLGRQRAGRDQRRRRGQ